MEYKSFFIIVSKYLIAIEEYFFQKLKTKKVTSDVISVRLIYWDATHILENFHECIHDALGEEMKDPLESISFESAFQIYILQTIYRIVMFFTKKIRLKRILFCLNKKCSVNFLTMLNIFLVCYPFLVVSFQNKIFINHYINHNYSRYTKDSI